MICLDLLTTLARAGCLAIICAAALTFPVIVTDLLDPRRNRP